MVCCGNPDAMCCGHPSGGYIWIPLVCALCGMALSITSTSYCSLAQLSNGQSVTLTGSVCASTTMGTSATVQCQDVNYEVDTFGIFTFQDNNTGYCIPYSYGSVAMDGFFISAEVFNAARWLCGMIVCIWLLLATCCPIRPAHKQALIILTSLAFMFQGLTFLFYGNYICQENGCHLAKGGYFAISAGCVFLLTIFALMPIQAKEASWVLQRQEQQQGIEPKTTIDSAEEGMKPAVTGVVLQEQP